MRANIGRAGPATKQHGVLPHGRGRVQRDGRKDTGCQQLGLR
jgi:hypothetical protein